jgi:PleD family two-component response regulator
MPTPTIPAAAGSATNASPAAQAQKVAIINGNADMLALLETVLNAGHYDIVFVESSNHAYSHIKRVQPNLIILCMRIEDEDGFHVLSMLKLDDETRGIPVLTYTTGYEGHDPEDVPTEISEVDEMFASVKPPLPMN